MYDYLIVGSGLFGASFANLCKKRGLKVLVVEKKGVVGGGIRSERKDNIDVHIYGPHIFHTSDKKVLDYFTSFCTLNNFINAPLANYKGNLYHLPFNMNTFYALWGTKTPKEAKEKIDEQVKEANIKEPKNLKEQALSLVGNDVYQTLIKGYTENSGDVPAKIFPLPLSRDFLSVSPTTTTTSMISIREYQSTAILKSSKKCSRESKSD